MEVRGIRLRTLLAPVLVAVLASLGLAWYGLLWIPEQQRYLNERNFRLLRTYSSQIKAKVDNFDSALDHALDSLDLSSLKTDSQRTQDLAKFLKLFAPELEVSTEFTTNAEQLASKDAGDPPRVILQRDEGRSYLYLGLTHQFADQRSLTIVARGDVQEAVKPYLAKSYLSDGAEFEALLVVDRDGHVIAQHTPAGGELTRVDHLDLKAAPVHDVAEEKSASLVARESPWMSSNSREVIVGDAAYRLYVQPIQLSLMRADPNRAAAADGDKLKYEDHAEEWALCGLVRAETFRAESSAISYTYLLWFLATLTTVLLAIPLIKLHVLNPQERYGRTDNVLAAAGLFVATALLTFAALDVYYFGYELRKEMDRQLEDAAESLKASFTNEVETIREQMLALDGNFKQTLPPTAPVWPTEGPKIKIDDIGPVCTPAWVCRTNEVAKLICDNPTERIYPYFDAVSWNDKDLQQQVKWTAAKKLTPFMNLLVDKQPYAEALARAQRSNSGRPQGGVGVLMSINTGSVVTVFWRTVGDDDDLRSQLLVLYRPPATFDHPILPQMVRFAVIKRSGQVIFHSDGARSLKENFFQEAEDDPALRSMILSGLRGALFAQYVGRRQRVFVMPLPLTSFEDPGWSLVVFRDVSVPETINLETLTLALAMFVVIGAAIAAAWTLWRRLSPHSVSKWFWPDRRKGWRYRIVVVVNAVLVVLFVGGALRLASTPLLTATAVIVIAGVAATYLIVMRIKWPTPPSHHWRRDFLWARTLFLVLIAVVPAMACFHAGYNYEVELFARSDQQYRVRAYQARRDAIVKRLEPLGLDLDKGQIPLYEPGSDPRVADFFDKRAPETPAPFHPNQLERFFGWVHRNYYNVATDPSLLVATDPGLPVAETATPSPVDPVSPRATRALVLARPSAWYLLIVAALLSALYALARVTLGPLYALAIWPGPGFTSRHRTPGCRACPDVLEPTAAGFLFVGPVETQRLHDPGVWTFDLRRLTFVGRRLSDQSVAKDREAGTPDWADKLDYSSLPRDPDTIIGIDHLDDVLSERRFCEQTLKFLDRLLGRYMGRIWLGASRETQDWLKEGGSSLLPSQLDRLKIVLNAFTRGSAEFPPGGGTDVDAERYRSLWSDCSVPERLALRQLAEEGAINPRNRAVVDALMSRGLVLRDPTFRIMNNGYRRFILQAVSADQVADWERANVKTPWAAIRMTMATVAGLLAAALLLTQQQVVAAWIGFVPALAPSVTTVLRWLSASGVTNPGNGSRNA